MNPTDLISEAEREFDEKFIDPDGRDVISARTEDIKSFLRTKIEEAYTAGAEEMKRRVLEGLPDEQSIPVSIQSMSDVNGRHQWNKCLSLIKDRIEKIEV